MAPKYLCVYLDMLPALEGLDYPEVGRLIIAALKYYRDGEQPTSLKGKETVLWPVFMSQIDRNMESYKVRCEINRNNRLSKTNRHESKRIVTNRDNRIEENRREENRAEQSRVKAPAFAPPTLEEVQAYCWERGNNIDPQHFLDYYSSNGWKVGRNPMKDWKAAVRTWERKEAPGRPSGKRTNNIFAEIAVEEGLF